MQKIYLILVAHPGARILGMPLFTAPPHREEERKMAA